jgi:hypothetical protein
MDDYGGDGSSNREKKKKEKNMLTHEKLKRAGRHDLRFALEQHDSKC